MAASVSKLCDPEFKGVHLSSCYNEALQENIPDEAIFKKRFFSLFWFSFKHFLDLERKRLSSPQLLLIC